MLKYKWFSKLMVHIFCRYGQVAFVKLYEEATIGFIFYASKNSAESAIKGLNGRSFHNRNLEVSWMQM